MRSLDKCHIYNSVLQEAAPEALPALGGGGVPQPHAVVQAAAGNEVAQVMEGHPPHCLGVVCVCRHAALLLEAPQLDAGITGCRSQMAALQKCETCVND